ncbi:MAG: VCBS repeat-containing protein [Candidatus Desulfofervidaceae bacterium]|nr:VCBS repeat-containing protein [Candidatus Desulfofervidaceae bacterium]
MIKKCFIWMFIFFSLCCFLTSRVEADSTPQKVAIIPFTLYAPPQLSYLKGGIYSMLVTRLSWPNKVEVIEKTVVEKAIRKIGIKEVPSQQQAQRLGEMLKVDYVLYGSVTTLGQGASIDAKFLDVAQKKVYPFFEQCANASVIILKVNALAADINRKVFGREIATIPSVPTPTQGSETVSTPLAGYYEPQTGIGQPEQKLRKWYSHPLPLEVRGLVIGDVDGDGKNELILIDNNTIWIYRYLKGRLILVKKKETSSSHLFVAVDLYDVNNDGREDLLISNVQRRIVRSIVYTWQKGKLVCLARDIPWYFRVQVRPNGKKVLLGQKSGTEAPFAQGIFRLSWDGKKFEATDRVCSLEGARIYNLTFGDLTGDELEDILMLDEEDYLVLMTKAGSKEWKSTEHYYGSFFYVEGQAIEPDTYNPRLERIYIPGRMLLTNLDKQPPFEAIVYQNHSRFGRILRDYKNFSSGEIKILSWDGLGMKVRWSSPKIHGCITDCFVEDFDNDGNPELVFTIVRRQKIAMFAKGRTMVVAYDLKVIKLR